MRKFFLRYYIINMSCISLSFLIISDAGIPVTQQHLIWESTELADDCSLCDYNIQNHSTLKLVLTLRGGPINTRRSKCRFIVTVVFQALINYIGTIEGMYVSQII